jgi:hypothetical protein
MATNSPKVPLTNLPGKTNWVEKYGALQPHGSNWIHRAAEHLKGKGMPDGMAIATAKNAAVKLCSTGDLNWPGIQHANFGSRAQACAAVAKWDAARARAKADLSVSDKDLRAVDLCGVLGRRILDLAATDGEGIDLATDAAKLYQSQRQQLAQKGQAMAGGRFPIRNRDDLAKAVKAVGRAKPATDEERSKVRRYIMRRAKELNATDAIPDSWQADGSVSLAAEFAGLVVDLAGAVAVAPPSFTGSKKKPVLKPSHSSVHKAAIDAAVAHLKKHPDFKNASDKQLRQAANRTVARQSLRHAIGITDVRNVNAKQAAVLREVNLLPGGKTDKAGKLSGKQRIAARQALGVTSLKTASRKQINALRKAGLIAGGTKKQRAGAKGFDESQHPRAAAGSSAGGQFAAK